MENKEGSTTKKTVKKSAKRNISKPAVKGPKQSIDGQLKATKKNKIKSKKGNSEDKQNSENNNEKIDAPKPSKVRDYSNDLKEYLSMWRVREETGQWKFNKVLQAWALDNCFEKDKIDAALFKELIPYILTVKGAALDRLSELALEIINGKIESEAKEETTKPNLKRALKIHQYLTGA